jgi:chaperonin GroEL
MDTTSIVHGDNVQDEVTSRIADLRAQLAEETNPHEKGALHGRISMLCGKVSTIYVGADTDIEQKEKRDRVDDAVLATRAAIEEGILPGGGIALIDCGNFPIDGPEVEDVTAAAIIGDSLYAPFNTILTNAGKDPEQIKADYEIGNGMGYNVKTSDFVDMIKEGVIDPAKVTKSALKNAVSVATTIMMTSAIITNDEQ